MTLELPVAEGDRHGAGRSGWCAMQQRRGMSRGDAEEYTQALGYILAGSWRQMYLAEKLGVPKALGLTVRAWVEDRLGGYIRLTLSERREAVAELTAEGMSSRGVADILGVSQTTAARDMRPIESDDSPSGRKKAVSESNDSEPGDREAASGTDVPPPPHKEARERNHLASSSWQRDVADIRRLVNDLVDALTQQAKNTAEILRRVPDHERDKVLERWAQDIGEQRAVLRALAQAWEQRDHYTDKGWRERLLEIRA